MLTTFLFSFLISTNLPETRWEKLPARENLVEFRLFYPFIETRNFVRNEAVYHARKASHIGLGLALSYRFFFTGIVGVVIEPHAWFTNLKINDVKVYGGGGSIEGGLVIRPLRYNYFDPTLSAMGGIGLFKSGAEVPARAAYPLSLLGSFNVLKDPGDYGDETLAMALTFGYTKYFEMIPSLRSYIYELGIAIRGSF